MTSGKSLLLSVICTAQMAQQDIRSILKTALCISMQDVLKTQLASYLTIEREALSIATSRGWDLPLLHTGKIRITGILVRIQFLNNNSNSKAAAWIIQGNTKGMISGIKQLRQFSHNDERVLFLTQKLLDCQQESIRQMQRFL